MEIFGIIFYVLFWLILIGAVLLSVVMCLSARSLICQCLYTRFFERDEWKAYCAMRDYIAKGNRIPIIGAYQFCYKSCDPELKDQYRKFIKDNPYYFLIFNADGVPELCGYDSNHKIILSAFFQKMCLQLAYMQEYTDEDFYHILANDIEEHERNILELKKLHDQPNEEERKKQESKEKDEKTE